MDESIQEWKSGGNRTEKKNEAKCVDVWGKIEEYIQFKDLPQFDENTTNYC